MSILLLGAQFKSISSESISRLRALHLSKVDLFSTFIQQILQKELSLLVGGLGHTMFIRHLFFFTYMHSETRCFFAADLMSTFLQANQEGAKAINEKNGFNFPFILFG